MPSFDRPADPGIPPSEWILRFAHLVKPAGRVLDVAAGHGRHSHFFLMRGCLVTAVDIDTSGLSDLATAKSIEVVERDLEKGPWPFDKGIFDAIVITNYLHRAHFPVLVETLSPDGVLLIETFGAGNEKLGRPRNPDFLLDPGELLSAFSKSLEVVAYEHGIEQTPRPSVRQRLCAIKAREYAVVIP